ncbi:MAG: MucR family transcriptional regulator [Rhodospirillales bacterium]|nr:MucR family transcriptional regulator [Rhodospirillales bacterium]
MPEKENLVADSNSNPDVLGLTAQIVSAHVAHNSVAAEALPGLIQEIYRTLSTVGTVATQPPKPEPAVSPKKSVFPDYIICLEDGKKLKMLKRHLKTSYNLTPEQYRERWGLDASYPMVAPNYAKHRSTLAKRIGLGTKPRQAPAGRRRG